MSQKHLLKRLELNGFKSFAGRTVLEFPSGITAIVGPNGSGKSNVVDALRWLLGEREAKNLRGAKVEDLVFAGTPKRPRMSQAQASLHFLNPEITKGSRADETQTRFFPVDFEEVVVTRQVSRDGTNRYFINKAEVLLRDLIDFFAKAKLGSRGLIIVGQGNSDMFIAATPKVRREMIEEILGLREYQLKKTEAERRLKTTEQNLEKVKALTEEILPHLRSLKRQTARWQRRGEFENELRSLENVLFGTQWRDLEAKISELVRDIKAHEEGVLTLKKAREEAEEKQKRVEAMQPQEKAELRELKNSVQKLMEERSRLGKDLGRLEARLEMESHSADSSISLKISDAVSLLKKIKDDLVSYAGKDLGMIQAGIEKLVREIDSVLSPRAVRSEGTSTTLKVEFEKINSELLKIEKDLRALHDKEKELEQGQEQFYETFKLAVSEVERAKDEIEKWEIQHQAKRFEKERIELRREELERQIRQAGRDPQEFSKISEAPNPEYGDSATMERRIFRLRGDLASIGEIDEALVKEASDTETRYEYLSRESVDLEKAMADLRHLIKDLDEKVRSEFQDSLVKINEEFSNYFALMFGGGHAKLEVVRPPKKEKPIEGEEPQEAKEDAVEDEAIEEDIGGIEIKLHLPRKKLNSLELLSGGERSLVGIAALFALISVSPPPFLVLDEIDAALDDRNTRRFAELLKEFSKKSQFIVVSHNRATMEAANILYGVTLHEDGSSKILSLKLE